METSEQTTNQTNHFNVGLWHAEQRDKERERQRTEARRILHETYEPPEFEEVVLAELRIDEKYQRARSEGKVDKLRAHFSPNACQPLAVSHRADGSRYLVDGQHRAAVLQDIGLKRWGALVYRKLSRRDEAAMWEEVNTRQTKPHPTARFKASLLRREPEAVAINGLVTGAGFALNLENRGRSSKVSGLQIDAIEAVIRIYRQAKAPGLADCLAFVKKAWPDPSETLRTARILLLGVSAFLTADWAHPVKRDRAATAIGKYTPSTWISKTRGTLAGESPTEILRDKLRAEYNRTVQKGEKL